MRIITGKYKFKKINVSKNIGFNPTSSFLKSNIFNILQNKKDIKKSVVVDLFAGTGSLGLEALSRDSEFVFFNDVNIKNCKKIKSILNSLNDFNNEVNNLNYLQFLLKLKQSNKKIDIFFIDPPFKNKEMIFETVKILNNENILNKNGLLIIISPFKKEFLKFKNFKLIIEKNYGKKFIYFLQFLNKEKIEKIDIFLNSKILIISGPSGVGKKQIIKNLIDNKELNLFYSISTTTRKKRKDEINNKDYNFISIDEFQKKINENKFLEYAKFIDNYYGTLKSTVKEIINKKKNVLLEIEIKGALIIKKIIPNAIWIFIFPPSLIELENRLKKRGTETKKQIEERISKAIKEIKHISINEQCDLHVVNDEVNVATKEITIFLKKKFNYEN